MLILILLGGAALLYLIQRILYKKFWNRGLDLSVRFDQRSVTEGGEGTLTEVLTNRSFLPLPFVHAKFMVGNGLVFMEKDNIKTSDQNYKNDIFSILFYQRITRRLPFTCEKRGYYTIDSADIVTSDLFYSVRMVAPFPQSAALYVYPKHADISDLEQPLRKIIGEMTARTFVYPDPFEFKGLRDYTISDPMNTINWKATARTGSLTVNTFNSTTQKRVVLLLDVEDETLIHHWRLHEESIRIAAALAYRFLSEGTPVRIVTNGKDCETQKTVPVLSANGPAEIEDVYRTLARIDINQNPEEFYPLIRREMEDPSFRTAGYILIASCMKKELTDAMTDLATEAASLYIAPLHQNMPSRFEGSEMLPVFRREVEGRA